MVSNIESSPNDELDLALNNAISAFHMEGKNLEQMIKKEDNFRSTYKKINLHYDTSVFPKGGRDIILKMKKSDVEKNSLEGSLLKNEQIQHLFATIVSSHITSRNERLERVKNQENRSEWDEYSEKESTPEKFEEFLLSDEGMQILINELNGHLDENGQIYDNYKITSEVLELKLRTARFDKIYREYNLEYLVDGIDEEENRMRQSINIVLDNVNGKVGDYLKMGGDKRGKGLLTDIDGLFSDEDCGFSYEDLKKNDFNRDQLRGLLKNKIQRYAGRILKIRKKENLGQYLGNTELDLQLKSYLYIYGKFFYPEEFNHPGYELSDYEGVLLEIFEAILHYDGNLDEVRNRFTEREAQAENDRRERERQKRAEIARRNRERNNHLQSAPQINKPDNLIELQTKSINPNNATGPELAYEANLGEKFDKYSLDIKESEYKSEWEKEAVFRDAWKEFIQSHNDIKSLITLEQMRRIFDINTNTIRISELNNFTESNPLLNSLPPDRLKKVRTILSGFSTKEARERLSHNSSEMKTKVNTTVKTYAIGTVIDNVRDTFDTISDGQNGNSDGLQLDTKNPVTIDPENKYCIIISGSFNRSDVKIRYNLETGELFMNSFLNRLSSDKISLGINSSINSKIGEIGKFNDILNNHYKLPPRSPKNEGMRNGHIHGRRDGMSTMPHSTHPHDGEESGNNLPPDGPSHPILIGGQTGPQIENSANSKKTEAEKLLKSQMNLINQVIENKTKSQSLINSSVNNFMKTFHIISGQFNSWDFNRGSNLYDIIEIIENTGNIENEDIQSLEYFNNVFMPTIVKYSGLIWGEWHNHQEINEDYEKLIKYDGNNDSIKALQYYSNTYNPEPFSGIANFDKSHQLGFAEFITGTNGQNNREQKDKINFVFGNEPNWKLSKTKMELFIYDLKALNKENKEKKEENSSKKNNADKRLSSQLPNI